MFDSFSEKQLFQIFGLISFVSVFAALFIYFALFPVNHSDTQVVEKQVLGVDPIAFEIAKVWNGANQGVKAIDIDSCNRATRIDATTWRVEMKAC